MQQKSLILLEKLIDSLPRRSTRELEVMLANAKAVTEGKAQGDKEVAVKLIRAIEAHLGSDHDEEAERLLRLSERDRIIEAFNRDPPSDVEASMIRMLTRSDLNGDVRAMAYAMGWKEWSAWNLHFGAMCRRREYCLNPAPSRYGWQTPKDDVHYSSLLAHVKYETWDDLVSFQPREAALEAFNILGLCASDRDCEGN